LKTPASMLTSSLATNTVLDLSTMSCEEKTRGKLLKSHSVSTGTSPPPQNISTQVRLQIITHDCNVLRMQM
jgi:thiamine biosynthesis protein ThiC